MKEFVQRAEAEAQAESRAKCLAEKAKKEKPVEEATSLIWAREAKKTEASTQLFDALKCSGVLGAFQDLIEECRLSYPEKIHILAYLKQGVKSLKPIPLQENGRRMIRAAHGFTELTPGKIRRRMEMKDTSELERIIKRIKKRSSAITPDRLVCCLEWGLHGVGGSDGPGTGGYDPGVPRTYKIEAEIIKFEDNGYLLKIGEDEFQEEEWEASQDSIRKKIAHLYVHRKDCEPSWYDFGGMGLKEDIIPEVGSVSWSD